MTARPLRERVCLEGTAVGLALIVDCVDGVGAELVGFAIAEDVGLACH